jgi:adenylosuccinate lyase
MAELWTDASRYALWARVEVLACEGWSEIGVVPADQLDAIRRTPAPDPDTVAEFERTRDHEILAFLAAYTAAMPESAARWVHHGMTSYDVVDTALGSTLAQSCDLVLTATSRLSAVLARRAVEHWDTVCVGRTHGIHAEPTTFGQKLGVLAFAVHRCLTRLRAARRSVAVGTISGPVGTYAQVDPRVEAYVCDRLGLGVESIPSQVVARDRHAELLSALAVLGAVVEQLAVESRLLQRTEVAEVEEPRRSAYQGSSAMPHKRNPTTSERLSGLARLLRANAGAAYENVALWHERDLAHSSVERVVLPDSLNIAYYQASAAADLVAGLVVFPERMRENLDVTRGLIYSSLSYTESVADGVPRETAYRAVQSAAHQAWTQRTGYLESLRKTGLPVGGDRLRPEAFLGNREHLRARLEELIEELG